MALSLALPSKGRLRARMLAMLERADLDFYSAGERAYSVTSRRLPGLQTMFHDAAEVARQLIIGGCHLGVTGQDLLTEASGDESYVSTIADFGVGRADVVVAVPDAWLDAFDMADVADIGHLYRIERGQEMRVATKYPNLARRFFAEKNILDYRLVRTAGSTEGAPAAGLAEFIVDITSSGDTLRQNQLKALADGKIMSSSARLFLSSKASWDEDGIQLAHQLLQALPAEIAVDEARARLRSLAPSLLASASGASG